MELTTQSVALVVAISLGLYLRSVVALVIAALVSSGLRTIMSHTFLPGHRNRLRWTPKAIQEILKFGRFIFLSTIFFFIGQRYDVFALGRLEGMAVIGVYWQAVNIVSVPTQMIERVSSWVLMPALAERFRESKDAFVRDLRRARLLQLPAASVLFLGAAMTAPAFFRLIYRDVYADAGWMVQLLVLNAWCMFMLEATSRALLALGETLPLAIGNGTRLVVTIASTMIGFSLGASLDANYGPLIGFMLGNAVGAFVGNLAIAQCLKLHGVDVRAMDIIATILFVTVGAAACWIPHLVERATGAPTAYTTLVGVVVVIAPLALYVRRGIRLARAS
jgi:O-antigen/teichoic acid export membrane protein